MNKKIFWVIVGIVTTFFIYRFVFGYCVPRTLDCVGCATIYPCGVISRFVENLY